MHSYLNEFMALALVHWLAVMSPGPDFALAISQSVKYGRRTGIWTALGIGAGISLHVVFSVAGLGALIRTSPWMLDVARLIGGAYISYLAWRLLRSAPQSAAGSGGDSSPDAAAAPQPWQQAWRAGFLTNATNPKATLFFLSVFTILVSPRTPIAIQALYGVWLCLATAAWFSAVALFFSQPRVRRTFLRYGHWFDRLMGAVLLLFAARLLWDMAAPLSS